MILHEIDKLKKDVQAIRRLLSKVNADIEYMTDVHKFHKYYSGCDPIVKWKEGEYAVRIVGNNDTLNHRLGDVIRIKSTNPQIIDDLGVTHFASSLRPATEDEIKKYLIDQAIKRSFVVGKCFKWKDEPISQIHPCGVYEYLAWEDALTVLVTDTTVRRAVYHKGEWAIPVFEHPRVKEEKLFYLESIKKVLLENHGGSKEDLMPEIITISEIIKEIKDQA